MSLSPGKRFRDALTLESPLLIPGTINAYSALLAKNAGFKALYLSGAGVANASFGLPDLGITTLNDVLEDARRITGAVSLPLLVDIDTGFGGAFTIERTVKEMIRAQVAAVHIEDQVQAKRCGHRPGKQIVDTNEMVDRIKAAVDARFDDFIIMARTDALALEGLSPTIERILNYVEAGADMVFFEGVRELSDYQALAKVCKVPILANITEFGVTPLFKQSDLKNAGVSMVLYPLTAFRAMSKAALHVYETLKQQNSQESLLPDLQTRDALYAELNYHAYEKKLDELFSKGKIK